MRFSITALTLFAGVALGSAIPEAAPVAAPDAAPAPDMHNRGRVHHVTVGGPGILAYNPPQVFAENGDTIIFEFLQANHTLTSANFNNPCRSNRDIDTGFVPNAAGRRGITRKLVVRGRGPQFFYCRQTGHCSKGMVFALNPSRDRSFEKFQQAALATSNNNGRNNNGRNNRRNDGKDGQ